MNSFRYRIKCYLEYSEFKITFGVLLLFSIAGMIFSLFHYYGSDYMYLRSAADNFFLVSTSTRIVRSIFVLLFPLLASMLCAGLLKGSIQKGNGLYTSLRMGKTDFIVGNASAVVVLTILSFTVIMLLNQIFCLIAFPLNAADNRWGTVEYAKFMQYDSNLLFDFWNIRNPYIYNLLYVLIISFLAGGIALVTYGMSFMSKCKKMSGVKISCMVYMFFLFLFVLGEFMKIDAISFTSYIEPAHSINIQSYFIYVGVIYLIGSIFTLKGYKEYEYI